MNELNDGGPAFPQPMLFSPSGQPTTAGMYFPDVNGMSLRDAFAIAAMTGLCGSPEMLAVYADRGGEATAAKGCYRFADAMLLARLNKPEALRAGE